METPVNFVALIPARLASSRLPNKPLALITGVPMVVHVARRARESGARMVAIATDSHEVASAVREHGFEVVMTRTDHTSGTERLAEAVALLALPAEEIVVNVQGDEPMMPPALIRQLALDLHRHPDCAVATAAHPIADAQDFLSPNVVKVVCDAGGRAMSFSRAPLPYPRDAFERVLEAAKAGQALPARAFGDALAGEPAFAPLRHIGIYAYRARFLLTYSKLTPTALEQIEALEQLRVLYHGIGIFVAITPHAPAAGVDTPADLERTRVLMQSGAPGHAD